jgi:hypothetical protein
MHKFDPEPVFSGTFSKGYGLAHCSALGVFVVSSVVTGAIYVVNIPKMGDKHMPRPSYSLGGSDAAPPMDFGFSNGYSGLMAFTGPETPHLLLVTDDGNEAVHVVDVVGREHVGYVTGPGTIPGVRGVATRGNLAAIGVSKRDHPESGVRLYEGAAATWTLVRVVGGDVGHPCDAIGRLHCANGLRFTSDGTELVVAEWDTHRVSVFRVEDGSFLRYIVNDVGFPRDVEECEGEWLVSCWGSLTIEAVSHGACGSSSTSVWNVGTRTRTGPSLGMGRWKFENPFATCFVPGLGLIVRDGDRRETKGLVHVLATHDFIAMTRMSHRRVGWMVAVARGIERRKKGMGKPGS